MRENYTSSIAPGNRRFYRGGCVGATRNTFLRPIAEVSK